jgi:hypothetical protein
MRGGASEREEVLYPMSDQMKAVKDHHLLFFWEEVLPNGEVELTADRLASACRCMRSACSSEAAELLREPSCARSVDWPLLAAAALVLLGATAVLLLWSPRLQWPQVLLGSTTPAEWEVQLHQRNESLNEREVALELRGLALDQREKSVDVSERTIYVLQQQATKQEQRLKEEAVSLQDLHAELDWWNATLAASQHVLHAKKKGFDEWKRSVEAELQRRDASLANTAAKLAKKQRALEEPRPEQAPKEETSWFSAVGW